MTTPSELSPGEIRILQLRADGHTNRQIAAKVHLAESTVKWHGKMARIKLGHPSTLDCVVQGLREGWIT